MFRYNLNRFSTIRYYILVIILFISSHSVFSKHFAFIVGVNIYDTTNVQEKNRVRPLEGCINDAISFSQILQSKYNLKKENIVHLFNEQATSTNILKTFDSFKEKVKPEDIFIFYFAGHGSQVINSLNNEPDHLDECLLTYDTPKNKYIRDFQLGKKLDNIALKGCKVTGIIDACHSGSLLRSSSQNARFHNINGKIDIKIADPIINPEKHGVVLISAAQDNQTAKESTNSKGIKHGVFTNELIDVLLFQSTGTSLFNIFEIVSSHLRNKNINQLPSIVGNKDRINENIIGAELEVNALHFPITSVIENGIIIQGGRLLGLFPNSILSTKNGSFYKVIQNIGFDKSKCIPVKGELNVSENDLLYLEYRELESTKIKIFCPKKGDSGMSSYIDIDKNYKFYRRKVDSPFLLETQSYSDAEYFLFQEKDSLLFIRSKQAPSFLPTDFKIKKIYQSIFLQKVVNIKNLLSLPSDEDYLFPYDLEVVNRSSTSTSFFLKKGDVYGIELKMNTQIVNQKFDSPFDIPQRYIYVLHVDNKGFLQQIYPSTNDDNRLPTVYFGKEAEKILLGPEKLFKVNPPLGHETFILIASEVPIYELPWINQVDKNSQHFLKSLKPKFRSGKYKWNIKYYHYSSLVK